MTFLGPSLGLRLRDDLAIGLSAFLVSTRLRHREDSTVVTDVRFDPELGVYRTHGIEALFGVRPGGR